MGGTGAVPGPEAGGDRSVRDGVVSEISVLEEAVTPDCPAGANKGSDRADGVVQSASLCLSQTKEKVNPRLAERMLLHFLMWWRRSYRLLHRPPGISWAHPRLPTKFGKAHWYGVPIVGDEPDLLKPQRKAACQAAFVRLAACGPFVINHLLCGRALNCSERLNTT